MPEGLNNNISAFQSLITCNLHLQPTAKPIMALEKKTNFGMSRDMASLAAVNPPCQPLESNENVVTC